MTRGYLTFAQNNQNTDYLTMAYIQALSIKSTQEINTYAVVVDDYTQGLIEEKHRKVFDYIIALPGEDESANDGWKLKNEWKALAATPFDETIKLESDMLFTVNLDHWWNILSQREMCFTTNVVDYTGKVSNCRTYRKVFDDNNLVNVYNGFYYFKKHSKVSQQFFDCSKLVYANWSMFRDLVLINCRDKYPTTDLVFAVAVKLCGDHNYYDPTSTVPRFAHMKGAINGWEIADDWRDRVSYQFDGNTITVGFTRQQVPFHYYQKDFISEEIINHYEQLNR